MDDQEEMMNKNHDEECKSSWINKMDEEAKVRAAKVIAGMLRKPEQLDQVWYQNEIICSYL